MGDREAARPWGSSWRQRVRLMPLFLAACAADALAPSLPARQGRSTPWSPGITVIIPERDAPAMLQECLDALDLALHDVAEPQQVIVVVNGAPPAAYAGLRERHPQVQFLFSDAPLGFARAIARGLAVARYDWALLLNNDMRLAPDALLHLMSARGDDVFALGAQILQRSDSGRREETGFTDWYADGNGVHLFHAEADERSGPVPALCASGGAALMRTRVLQEYLPASFAYDPFYWEDAEWGVRAWRDGWRVLFVPAARAQHRHRATTARFYPPEELDRIVERNRLLFEARHRPTPEPASGFMRRVCDLPYASQRELASARVAAGVFRRRIHARRAPQPLPPPVLWQYNVAGVALAPASYSYRLRAQHAAARPTLLLVTPFAVFPPRHGGARRIAELVRCLCRDYDVVLVSDEADLYDARSFAWMDGLAAAYLVRRAGEERAPQNAPMDARMRVHAHPALAQTVAAAIARHRPAVVQIEHAELAGLVTARQPGERWVLSLHDACSTGEFSSPQAFQAFERDVVQRFDAVIVCSPEDGALVQHPRIACVPNGSSVRLGDYQPSQAARLLFIGPFRYAPNVRGIEAFVRDAYPRIRAAMPAVELIILGGDEALQDGGPASALRQPGVHVHGHRDDVPVLLRECTLTINPLHDIRGSAVKLIESLSAGRACVTTRDGARGFEDAGFAGLIIVDDVPAMVEPIVRLLSDPAARHRLEQPDVARLQPYQWDACAAVARTLYRTLLADRSNTNLHP